MKLKYVVILIWFLAVLHLFLSGCATFEPDNGPTQTPPTFHWHEYVPPKTTPEFIIYFSGSTLKNIP